MTDRSNSKVKDTLKFTEQYEKQLKEYVLSHSKISARTYNQKKRNEWFMDSAEMLKYGLVDEVI